MKRFSRSKTYKSKDGNRYSYEMKYRGRWQFFKFSDKDGKGGGLCCFYESQLNEMELKEC